MDAYDHDLLTRFRTRRDEDAFRQLVQRHLGMIYAVSYRVTGSREQADEIAQSTFARLADKSVGITRETALAGWLYQTARHLALSAIRSDARRRQREQIAAAMNLNEPSPNVVAEYLEPAMEQLAPDDRDALLLRFFEDRSLREVGQELGLSEDAARMRVNRAIEKMRDVFAKLGITGTAAWLASTLTTSATASVPAGLGATITTAVLGGTAVAAVTMNLFNLKTAAAIVAAAAVTGTTTYFVQEREAGRLRAENASINETHAKLTSDRQEAMALVQLRDEQIERLKRDVADLPRLRGEVDGLRRRLAETDRLLVAQEAAAEESRRQQKESEERTFIEASEAEAENDSGMVAAKTAIRFIQGAVEQYRLEHDGKMPATIEEVFVYVPKNTSDLIGGTGPYRLNNFSEMPLVRFSQLPKDTIVITDREARRTQSGEYFQSYYLADGSVEVVKGGVIRALGANEQYETLVRQATASSR